MCDWSDLIGFGGTALQAAGQTYRGFATSRAAKLSAEVARGNTEILLQNAQTERAKIDFAYQKGAFESSRLLSNVERVIGGQTAHFAANNLDPSTGSPLLLAGFTAAQGQIDAELILARAGLDAADAQARVASLTGKASASAFEEVAELEKADAARMAGLFGAGATTLSAITRWPGLQAGNRAGVTSGGAYDPSNPFLLNTNQHTGLY